MKPLTLDELAKACKLHGMEWPAKSADAPYQYDLVSLAISDRGDAPYRAFHAYWKERGLAFFQEHYGAPIGFVIERANQVLETLD